MTLIAAFEVDNAPILVGDILLSVVGPINTSAPTPLVHAPDQFTANANWSVVGSRQKLVIIHPHLCIAWAGSLLHAQALCEYVRSFVHGLAHIDYGELRIYLNAYPRSDLEGHVWFVIYSLHPNGSAWFSNLTPFEIDEIENIRVEGTGAPNFIEKIQQIVRFPVSGIADAYNTRALQALSFAGIASAQQFFHGTGIADAWGGAFEVVIKSENGLQKLGPLCWLFWRCVEVEATKFILTLQPAFIYQYYAGDALMLWVDEGEIGKLHAITPPFTTSDPLMVRPDLIDTARVISLINLETLAGDSISVSFVDQTAPDKKPDVTVEYDRQQNRTSLAFQHSYFDRFLPSLPLSGVHSIAVQLWDGEIFTAVKQPDHGSN